MVFVAEENERYWRQLNLPELGTVGQKKLKAAAVLIVGLGGLGHASALALAGAGIGRLGLIDAGKVEISNLPRQLSYNESDVGLSKTVVLKELISKKNSSVKIEIFDEFLTGQNSNLFKQYDFIIDAVDNFETKFLINDLAVQHQKPFSHAGVLRWQGQLYTYLPGKHCLRCFLPEVPRYDDDNYNAKAGIVNSLPGVVGYLQALEAVKYFTNSGVLLSDSFLTIDLLSMEFKKSSVIQLPHCKICGAQNV